MLPTSGDVGCSSVRNSARFGACWYAAAATRQTRRQPMPRADACLSLRGRAAGREAEGQRRGARGRHGAKGGAARAR